MSNISNQARKAVFEKEAWRFVGEIIKSSRIIIRIYENPRNKSGQQASVHWLIVYRYSLMSYC